MTREPLSEVPEPGCNDRPWLGDQLLGDYGLGGQQERRDRRRVLEGQPRDPHRVDHPLLDEVSEASCTVLEAIRLDEQLTIEQKEALIGVYRGFLRR